MTTIALQRSTVLTYLGTDRFDSSHPISTIHIHFDVDSNEAHVKAQIPSSSTKQSQYTIKVRLRSDGSEIIDATCTCPVGVRCKHIHNVLCHVVNSASTPIKGADPAVQAHQTKRRRLDEPKERASVYIAFACMSERENDYWAKEKYDEKVLGVYFSKALANQRAIGYVRDELGIEMDDDDDDDEDDGTDEKDDDDESYAFESEEPNCENSYDKVWVECHAIEDS